MHDIVTILVRDQLVDLEFGAFERVPGWSIFTRAIGARNWTVSCLCPACRAKSLQCAHPSEVYQQCAAAEIEPCAQSGHLMMPPHKTG